MRAFAPPPFALHLQTTDSFFFVRMIVRKLCQNKLKKVLPPHAKTAKSGMSNKGQLAMGTIGLHLEGKGGVPTPPSSCTFSSFQMLPGECWAER